MKNLEFESINDFKLSKSAEPVVKGLEKDTSCTEYIHDDYVVQSTTTNFLWIGTILISFVIWIICIISLILNCVRKSAGKAIFSGIGLIVPLISIFLSTLGKGLVDINDDGTGIGMFLSIFALVIEVVVGIITFIFCFSKSKNKITNG